MVTPRAIRIKIILIKIMLTRKITEYPIVINKRDMDIIFIFNGTVFVFL